MISLNKKVGLIGLVLAASIFFSSFPSQTSALVSDTGSSCAVDEVGWFACPAIGAGARASDAAMNLLDDNFLEVPPELFNNQSPTKGAWEQAKNIANIAFVVAFLVLIYSQISGGFMSNYGIKKMLPRLIIAAIFVNISYYICQALVDISNILGFNLKATFDAMSANLPQVLGPDRNNGLTDPDFETANGVAGSGLSNLATIALTLGAIAWAAIAILTGSIGVVLGMVLFTLIVLLLRKAFIVLLIVASPLAFVAYLLPNTERFFKQWLTMFWKLLMVFPIIAILLGAGQLASGIVLNAGVNRPGNSAQDECVEATQTTKITGQPCGAALFDTGHGQAPIMLGITAAIIAVGPLLFAKKVADESIAVGGKMFAEMSGKVESVSKTTGKFVGDQGKSLIGKTNVGAGAQVAWAMRKQNKERSHVERGIKGLNSHNSLARLGKDQERTLAAAAEHAHEMEQKDIKEQRALAQYKLDNNRRQALDKDGKPTGMSMTSFNHLEAEYDEEMAKGDKANLAKLNALKTMLDGQGEDGQKAVNNVMAKHMARANKDGSVNHILQEHARHVALHDTGMLQTNAAGYMTYFAASIGATTAAQAATSSLGVDADDKRIEGDDGAAAISAHTFAQFKETYGSSNVGDLVRQIKTHATGADASTAVSPSGVKEVLSETAKDGSSLQDIANAAAETRAATRADKV